MTSNSGVVAGTTPEVETRGLTKRFGGIVAVSDLDFTVNRGEMIGLIGPNGAGKSTVVDLLSGVQKSTSGQILVGGESIDHLSAPSRRHMGVVRTFQIVKPFRGMTALENVTVAALFGKSRVASHADATEAARLAMEFVGMRDKGEALASSLNLAEQKLLELARAVAAKPRILVLDEVMGGLDPESSGRVAGVVRKINEEGVTIIIIEHVLKQLFSLVPRLVVMHEGKKLADGSVREITSNEHVVAAYLGSRFAQANHG